MSRNNSPSHSTLSDSAGRIESRITAIPSTLPLQDFNRSAGAWPSRILSRISAGSTPYEAGSKTSLCSISGGDGQTCRTACSEPLPNRLPQRAQRFTEEERLSIIRPSGPTRFANEALPHQPQHGAEHSTPAQQPYRQMPPTPAKPI